MDHYEATQQHAQTVPLKISYKGVAKLLLTTTALAVKICLYVYGWAVPMCLYGITAESDVRL